VGSKHKQWRGARRYVDMKEYIACDAVCLVITWNDIDSIPLLSLGISRIGMWIMA